MVTKGIAVLDELKIAKKTVSAIEEVSTKIKPPSVEIRGIAEITCNKSDGVEVIKNALLDAIGDQKANVNVVYIGATKVQNNCKRSRL